MDCVFCNIINKQVPSEVFYEDDAVLVIQDILPQAPVHMLVISKKHIASISDVTDSDEALLGKMIVAARTVAEKKGINNTGYKLMFNVGKDGGQIVPHIHLHILGGKKMQE